MIGGLTERLPAGDLLFTARYRGYSITVGHATAAELADIAEQPTSEVVDELTRWGLVAVRSSPGGRRTTLHAIGWQRSQASPWVTSPLREVTLGPITVGTVSGQATGWSESPRSRWAMISWQRSPKIWPAGVSKRSRQSLQMNGLLKHKPSTAGQSRVNNGDTRFPHLGRTPLHHGLRRPK